MIFLLLGVIGDLPGRILLWVRGDPPGSTLFLGVSPEGPLLPIVPSPGAVCLLPPKRAKTPLSVFKNRLLYVKRKLLAEV